MASYQPLASDLSYRVLEKQRRDPQVVLSPAHKPIQVRESRLDLDQLFRADEIVRDDEISAGHYWKHGKR